MDAAQYAVRVNEEPEYAQQQAYDYEGQPMNQKESGRMHQSQPRDPNQFVHKPKGFNVSQFKKEYDGEIYYEKDSNGRIVTLPTYRESLKAS